MDSEAVEWLGFDDLEVFEGGDADGQVGKVGIRWDSSMATALRIRRPDRCLRAGNLISEGRNAEAIATAGTHAASRRHLFGRSCSHEGNERLRLWS